MRWKVRLDVRGYADVYVIADSEDEAMARGETQDWDDLQVSDVEAIDVKAVDDD